MILLDTSILIDYYRKKDKSKSKYFDLINKYGDVAVSAISLFEIYTGAGVEQIVFWNEFFKEIPIIPFTEELALIAADIDKSLRKINKQIDSPDLFIVATAVGHQIPCATLNTKHFERVEHLEIIG